MSEAEAVQVDTGSQVEGSAPSEQQQAAPVNFIDTLPDDLRGETTLQQFNNVGDLAKSYVHQRKFMGHDKMLVPGKHTTESEYNEIYKKLGRPDTPDGYDFQTVDNFKQSGLDFFNEVAHSNGLSPKQAENIARSFIEQSEKQTGELLGQGKAQTQEGLRKLKENWGEAYDQKIEIGNQAAERLNAVGILTELKLQDGRALGEVPDIINFFVNLGEQMQEDNLIGQPDEVIMTPGDAKKEYSELFGSDAHMDRKHPKHQFVVDRVMELQELMTPQIQG